MRPIHATRLAIAVLALAATGAAQVMSSSNFRIDGLSFDAAVGGSSSQTFTVYAQLGPFSGGESSTATFKAETGFLSDFDPAPDTLPVVYGIVPRHADKAGGTPLTAYGRNLGLAPAFTVGGAPVAGSAVSGTKATLTSPVGAAGEVDVTVDNGLGLMTLTDGFIFSPAIDAPLAAHRDSLWPIGSYGSTLHTFQMYASPTAIPGGINTNYGVLLIGPVLINLIPGFPYLPPDGKTQIRLRVPDDPAIVGFTFHLQNLNLDPMSSPGQLTNAVATTFL